MLEAIYSVQASSDLATWTTIATKSSATTWGGSGNVIVGAASGGFVPVAVEDTIGGTTRFLRLQIAWVP